MNTPKKTLVRGVDVTNIVEVRKAIASRRELITRKQGTIRALKRAGYSPEISRIRGQIESLTQTLRKIEASDHNAAICACKRDIMQAEKDIETLGSKSVKLLQAIIDSGMSADELRLLMDAVSEVENGEN